METVADAAGRRLAGERPGRAKALLAAGVTGVSAAVIVYRLLRSGGRPPGEARSG